MKRGVTFPSRGGLTGCLLAMLLSLLEVSVGWAQVPTPVQGSSRPRPPEETTAVPSFEFHSTFWINLHHFLYQQAREQASARPQKDLKNDAWAKAVDFYARELAGRDLLVNGDMVNIKNRLAEMEGCEDLSGRGDSKCFSGLRPELVEALEQAAPVYRARWWAEHDRTNRAWVEQVTPLVESLGSAVAERLAAVYQEQWPKERLRVDVSYLANWAGAYTTLNPAHITISSSNPANQGPAALEILFHEASHTIAEAVRAGIARECRARNKPIPRDLWHALLFYTTGEVVRRALQDASAAPGRPSDYMPYAYRQGLYARGWQNYLRVLERHWQAYLDGRIEFDRAIARLVSAL